MNKDFTEYEAKREAFRLTAQMLPALPSWPTILDTAAHIYVYLTTDALEKTRDRISNAVDTAQWLRETPKKEATE